MIIARIINPKSKLATCRGFNYQTCSHSLGQLLNLETATENELYSALDWLLDNQGKIEDNLAKKHLISGSLVLYDVTSSYLEGTKCELGECMLAYYVEWHLRKALAPLLFEDQEVSDTTNVMKAIRSESAIAKDRKKLNREGLPVHSFRTLLEDLGTICLNKVKYTNSSGEYIFSKITQPTSLQQECLDLLGVSLICTQ